MLFTISADRGVGKTRVSSILSEEVGLKQIVTHTTRPPRLGEVEGRDYYFETRESFDRLRGVGRGLVGLFSLGDTDYGISYEECAPYATPDECSGVEDLAIINVALTTAFELRDTYGPDAVRTLLYLPKCYKDIRVQMQAAGIPPAEIEARVNAHNTDLNDLRNVDQIIVNGFGRLSGAIRATADFILEHSGVDVTHLIPHEHARSPESEVTVA